MKTLCNIERADNDRSLAETANLVDIAPTLATVLGDALPEAEGRILRELLK